MGYLPSRSWLPWLAERRARYHGPNRVQSRLRMIGLGSQGNQNRPQTPAGRAHSGGCSISAAMFDLRAFRGSTAASIVLCAGFFGDTMRSEEAVTEGTLAQLSEGVAYASAQGDFETGWDGLERILTHTREIAELRASSAGDCKDCPELADLAWLLGKPRAALDLLDGFCDSIRYEGCVNWLQWAWESKRVLSKLGARNRQPRQIVRLQTIEEVGVEVGIQFEPAPGDRRPWVVVSVAGERIAALVDTGGQTNLMARAWANRLSLDYELLRERRSYRHAGSERSGASAVLHDFRFGVQKESRLPAMLVDEPMPYMYMGMPVLLRYDAVCFSWSEKKLYLGELGPCQVGEQAFAASLIPSSLHPILLTETPPIRLLVDTGDTTTRCHPQADVKRLGSRIRFGRHSSMVGRCADVVANELAPRDAEDPWVHASLGMDTLSRFEAVGWKLNPFAMFFVPTDLEPDEGS